MTGPVPFTFSPRRNEVSVSCDWCGALVEVSLVEVHANRHMSEARQALHWANEIARARGEGK